MKNAIFLAMTLSSILFASSSWSGDVKKGETKAGLCVACHGAKGLSAIPTYPNLAGQNEAYLVSALKSYKNKDRKGGAASIMQMQAANLSDSDIDNLAAYYASLK
jgi:cytochrome c553